MFPHYKKTILGRADKSNKGSIGEPIRPLIETINKLPNYCTNSSCSGRTVIFVEPKSGKKYDISFLFMSHNKITFTEIKEKLHNLPKNTIWFRFEPMIIHIACDTLESANNLLVLARQHFKHSGILSLKHFIVEIRGSGFIEAPIAVNGKIIVSDEFLNVLCDNANKKLAETHKRMDEFKTTLEKIN